MNIFDKLFSSNRDKDYTRLTSQNKEMHYLIKRGKLLHQLKDRMKWHLYPKFFRVPSFPTHLDIEIAVSCQLKCPMCQRERMPDHLKWGIMNIDLFKKIVDECAHNGVYSIKLSWRGEPLLNPKVVDMVKYAKDKGIKDVAFLTNGERMTPELAKGLVDAGVDWLSFSVDGLGDTYDRIRYPSTFETIVPKIKLVKNYRDSKKQAKPLIRVQTIWGAIKEDPEVYFNFWEKIVDKVCVIADQERWEYEVPEKDPNYICFEPWRRFTIGWNGKVLQCIVDYEQTNEVGDVNKQTLREIWHGKKMTELRESIKNGKLFDNKACNSCHEPCIMEEQTISLGKRKLKIHTYKGQSINVKNIDRRPTIKKEKKTNKS